YWLKSGFFSLLDRGTIQVFRFLSFFLLVRGLSKEDFGLWSLYLTLSGVVEMIRVGLIQNALVRFLSISSTGQEKGEISTASLTLSLAHSFLSTGLLLLIAFIAGRFWNLHPLDDLLLVYIPATFAMSFYHHFLSVQQAHLPFQGTFWTNAIRQFCLFAGVAYLYFFARHRMNLTHLVYAHLGSILVGAVVAAFTGRKYANFTLTLSWGRVKEIIDYGKWVVGTYLSTTLIKSIDQVLLGILVSPVGVASYSTAMRVAHLVEVPIQAIAAVVFPQSARKMREQGKDSIAQIYERSVGVILAMVIPGVIFVVMFAELVLTLIAGARYLDAVPVLQVVMFYALLLPFSRQFGTIVESIGKPRYQFWLLIGGTGLNLFLNYFLIRHFGTMGAAYASIGTYLVVVVGSLIVLKREVGVELTRILRFTFSLYQNGFGLLWRKVLRKESLRY
ncbi:MAG: flippase, partial [Bacteroidota bacterium]